MRGYLARCADSSEKRAALPSLAGRLSFCYNTNEKTACKGLPFQSCRRDVVSLTQGTWRKALKLRVVVQIIAAVASAITAIHQLLKK